MAKKVKDDVETINFITIEENDLVVLTDGKYGKLRHCVSTPCQVTIPRMQYLTTFDIVNEDGEFTGDHKTVSLTDADKVVIKKRVAPGLLSRLSTYLFG
mgnify:CR=1 FL=1